MAQVTITLSDIEYDEVSVSFKHDPPFDMDVDKLTPAQQTSELLRATVEAVLNGQLVRTRYANGSTDPQVR